MKTPITSAVYSAKTLLLLVALMLSQHASAVHSVVWDRTVIRINLTVGVEQVVYFPADGAVGLPPTLANPSVFRTLFAGQTAYWKALQPFASERIKVRLSSGEFILFDVSAKVEKAPPATADPINVVLSTGENPDLAMKDKSGAAGATLFDLIRYAAQVTYSPPRLVAPVPGIRQVPVGVTGNINRLYNLREKGGHAHHGLVFTPVKSWTANGLYVTAIRVKNRHTHSVALDNRLVQHTRNAAISGVKRHFMASSFYRSLLQPKGEKGDRTTLFVVTDKPFASTLRL